MYAVQMLCYILDTFQCGNQIFLSLDKYDGKEIGFTEVLVCGLFVWLKLIKWQMTCPLLSACQYKKTPAVWAKMEADDVQNYEEIHIMEKKYWKSCSQDFKHKTKEAYNEIRRWQI